MPVVVPTTQQSYDTILAELESSLNQTSPLADKAFLRVLAAVMAGSDKLVTKYGAWAVQQNLAISAGLTRLKEIGENYGTEYTYAQPAIIECEIRGNAFQTLTAGTIFVGESNGLRYAVVEDAEGAADLYTFLAQCLESGVDGNVSITDRLIIGTPDPVFDNYATVEETDPTVNTDLQYGIDDEDVEDYRRRVLNEIRTVGGGSNGVDYRTWGEETPGIIKVFPYSDVPEYDIEDHDVWGETTAFYFKDKDCEWPTTTYWKSGNGATLAKVNSPVHSGSKCLEITENGAANPYAYQPISGSDTCLRVGVMYNFTGYARGTVNPAVPQIIIGGVILWEHGGGAVWEEFDISFVATDTEIWLGSDAAMGSGNAVYFDTMDMTLIAQPGDRVVYCECDHGIDHNGIPTQSYLDSVREYINTDPDTGKTRPSLGHTNDSLWVEPITRKIIYTEIRGLDVDPDILDQVKDEIEDALSDYFLDVVPYVEGVDPIITRNDKITDLTVSQVVQDILTPVGGSADGIGIGTEPHVFIGTYQLSQGEMAARGNVYWV